MVVYVLPSTAQELGELAESTTYGEFTQQIGTCSSSTHLYVAKRCHSATV